MTLSTPKNQRGFLSIDGVMWIMLITIALGFIAWFGYKMLGNSDGVIEQSNITTIITNTKKLKGSSGYGTSGTNLVPSLIAVEGAGSMGVSGTNLTNQWNGAVTLVSNGMTFTLGESNVPKAACITLATKVGKDKQTTTSINGGTATAGEVLPATAATSCSNDFNSISWTTY
ncbi:type 4 pilus major pilin [Pseudomonas fluorescens]|uniref:type 4 pilus major pilin n=1 Tax=Pseudomonas fluorescens TaxID=294 RepID=UPI000641A6C2|nr:type 4 pilus major pilin [Pseudomonas fluorescens]